MTDIATPVPAAPAATPAIVAALESAAATAVSSLEANAVAYINGLEAKAKTELGIVEGKLEAIWTKVKTYAKPALAAAVLGGGGYVVAHFLHL
jgi:hypothetical protein